MKLLSYMIAASSKTYSTITPLLDRDHFAHNYFLPREHAIIIPSFGGVALLSLLVVILGKDTISSSFSRKSNMSTHALLRMPGGNDPHLSKSAPHNTETPHDKKTES
ncbi:hypothetical protein SUGI_1194160 [Cryptomeria japonica]|nr:hypothetical protein SUGI_1194160 [Cryptomeria japonica]